MKRPSGKSLRVVLPLAIDGLLSHNSRMEKTSKIRLGTRGSPLARWQADWVAAQLRDLGIEVEMIHITTQGDVKGGPIGNFGGQGVFTKEIQRALLDGEIDVAVHSLKDLPTEPVPGLKLGAVPEREDCGDVLVTKIADSVESLPENARVGTGSMRRQAQLQFVRPDLKVSDIRGNVDTRLRKLDEGEFEAIVLAAAGLKRLGLTDRILHVIPKQIMLPAIGQGALGIEIRDEDPHSAAAVAPLDHAASHQAVLAERAMLARLRGGCLAPVGAWGRIDGEKLKLEGVVLSPNGKHRLFANLQAPPTDAVLLGMALADELLQQGAAELIADSRKPVS